MRLIPTGQLIASDWPQTQSYSTTLNSPLLPQLHRSTHLPSSSHHFIHFPKALSYGVTLLDANTVNDTEYVFTPIDARGKYERDVLNHHWPLRNDRFIPGKFLDMKLVGEVDGDGDGDWKD